MQNNSTYRMFEDKTDQLFHDGLQNQSFGHTDADWQQLNKRLDEHERKQRRGSPVKWGLSALLLLLGTVAAWQFWPSASKNEPVAQQTELTTSDAAQKQSTAAAPTQEDKQQSVQLPVDNQNNNPLPQQPINDNSRADAAHSINTTTNPSVVSPTASAMPVMGEERSTKQPSIVKKGFVDDLYVRDGNRGLARRKSAKQSAVIQKQNTGTETVGKEKSENDISDESETIITSETGFVKQSAAIEPNATDVSDKKNDVVSDKNETVASTAPVTIETKETPALPKVKTKREKTERTPVQPVEEDGWFVSSYLGVNSSKKDAGSFAAFLAPAGYNEKRLNQENALKSLQAGVQFTYRTRQHVLLSAGLGYFTLGDRVNYDASYSGNVALGANGRSRFAYLEIPLTVGYEWTRNRWGFALQGGISTGILLNAKGSYVSTTQFSSQLFNLAGNKQIFRKTVFSLLASPSVHYYMNDRTSIFVAPTYRLNLQPITKTGSELSQKYLTPGLQIGVRKRF